MTQLKTQASVSRPETGRWKRRLATSFVFWRYDARRALPFWGASLTLVAILTVLPDGPLTRGDSHVIFEWAGGLTGIVLAWRLFADTRHTQAYVFSRGLSRTWLFWNRWTLGMAILTLHVALLWLVLISGLRSGWRLLLDGADAPAYPLVAPYETVIVPPFGVASMLAFAVTTLLLALRGLQKPSRVASGSGALAWFLVDLPLTLLVVFYGQSMFASPLALSTRALFAVAAVAAGLFTLIAWHGYRNWEVSS